MSENLGRGREREGKKQVCKSKSEENDLHKYVSIQLAPIVLSVITILI